MDQKQLNQPALVLVMGISTKRGVEHSRIFRKSVNMKNFIQFLEELRILNEKKINCHFHGQPERPSFQINKKETIGIEN